MSGLELARYLRQDLGLSDSLLVALSAFAHEEDRHRSQEAGFNAHLTKPVSLNSLKEVLANVDLASVSLPRAYSARKSSPHTADRKASLTDCDGICERH